MLLIIQMRLIFYINFNLAEVPELVYFNIALV